MSKINEDKVSFKPPTKEDETAKKTALDDWTNDRMENFSVGDHLSVRSQ